MSSEIPTVTLPQNTMTHAEIHQVVAKVAEANNIQPEKITFYSRGEKTQDYALVVRPGHGHITEDLVKTRKSTVGSTPIFTHDEFIVHFSGDISIKFITPELQGEQL